MVVKCCSLKVTVFLSRQGCSGMMNEAIHKSEVFKHLQLPLESTGILDYWDLASKTRFCMRLRIPRAIGLVSHSVYLMKHLEWRLQKCWLFGCMFVMGDLISKAQGPGLCQGGCLEVGRNLSVAGRGAQWSLQKVRDRILLPREFLSLLHYNSHHIQRADLLLELKGMNELKRMRRGEENATIPLGRAAFFFFFLFLFNFSIQLIFYCGFGGQSHRNPCAVLQYRTVSWSMNTAPAQSCLEALCVCVCVSAFLKVSHGFVSCECAFSPAHSWNA